MSIKPQSKLKKTFSDLRGFYDIRFKILQETIEKICGKIKEDELIDIMKEDEDSDRYTCERIKEIFEQFIAKDQALFIREIQEKFNYKEKLEQLQKENEEKNQENQRFLNEESEAFKGQYEAIKGQFETSESQKEEIKGQFEALKCIFQEQIKEKELLESQKEAMKEQFESLKASFQEKVKENDSLERQNETIKEQFEALKNNFNESVKEKISLECQKTTIKEQFEALKCRFQEKIKEKESLKCQKESIKEQFQALTSVKENLNLESQEICKKEQNEVLKRSFQGKLKEKENQNQAIKEQFEALKSCFQEKVKEKELFESEKKVIKEQFQALKEQFEEKIKENQSLQIENQDFAKQKDDFIRQIEKLQRKNTQKEKNHEKIEKLQRKEVEEKELNGRIQELLKENNSLKTELQFSQEQFSISSRKLNEINEEYSKKIENLEEEKIKSAEILQKMKKSRGKYKLKYEFLKQEKEKISQENQRDFNVKNQEIIYLQKNISFLEETLENSQRKNSFEEENKVLSAENQRIETKRREISEKFTLFQSQMSAKYQELLEYSNRETLQLSQLKEKTRLFSIKTKEKLKEILLFSEKIRQEAQFFKKEFFSYFLQKISKKINKFGCEKSADIDILKKAFTELNQRNEDLSTKYQKKLTFFQNLYSNSTFPMNSGQLQEKIQPENQEKLALFSKRLKEMTDLLNNTEKNEQILRRNLENKESETIKYQSEIENLKKSQYNMRLFFEEKVYRLEKELKMSENAKSKEKILINKTENDENERDLKGVYQNLQKKYKEQGARHNLLKKTEEFRVEETFGEIKGNSGQKGNKCKRKLRLYEM